MKKILILVMLMPCMNVLGQNVGIGTNNPVEKLEVNGGVKIGNTSNAVKGTIRWNEQKSDFEGYNGLAWVSLTGGKSGWGNQQNYSTESSASLHSLDITPTDMGTELGFSIDAHQDWLIAGAYRDVSYSYSDKIDIGSAIIFKRSGDRWEYKSRAIDPDKVSNDFFGYSVGMTATHFIAGAPGAGEGLYARRGKAYIYTYGDNGIALQSTLLASDGAANDLFGRAVAISGDYALIGAPGNDVAGVNAMGRAYVFQRNGSSWTQMLVITPPDGVTADNFGNTLSIDGDLLAISSEGKTVSGVTQAGKVYVYRRSGSTWNLIAEIVSPDNSGRERFGASLQLNNGRLAVGATHYNGATDDGNGKLYIFSISDNTISFQHKIEAPDGQKGDAFGSSVEFLGDIILVGASYAVIQAGGSIGKAYAYKFDGQAWIHQATLAPSTRESYIQFGRSVALTPGTAIIGAPRADLYGRVDNGQLFFFKW